MNLKQKHTWFETALRLKGSVVSVILPRILIFTFFAVFVCLFRFFVPGSDFILYLGDLISNVVYNLVLGLLLVFRTNTSYDRFWDGRKSLGIIVINIRNLARYLKLTIPEQNPPEKERKLQVFNLLIAFAVATKLQLRGEKANLELKKFLNKKQAREIDSAQRMSLQIALWIGEYLQDRLQAGVIDTVQRMEMNNMLNNMIEGLSSCERIVATPLPIAYRIYLKRLILIYCFALPFNIVDKMQWWTVLVVTIISFILLGIEEIGKELENPFLCNENAIPIDRLCSNVMTDVETIVKFSPEEFLPTNETIVEE